MKKAKEYASEILSFYDRNKNQEDLSHRVLEYVVKSVFVKLVDEMQEMADARKCNTGYCLEAMIKEQDIKWSSIVTRVNKEVPMLKRDGFLHALGRVRDNIDQKK